MISVYGIYKDGKVVMDNNLQIEAPAKVLITFLEKVRVNAPDSIKWEDFHFDESRELLKGIKGNLSDDITKERRED
jgi:hypothetical protein